MKTEKIKKGCGITLIILLIILLISIVGFFWMIKAAFGPTFRTVKIDNPVGQLICEEVYNADMAAVFYDVDFTLEIGDNQIIDLGRLYFQKEDWLTEFELKENKYWYCLSSNNSNIHDLVLTDKISQENYPFDMRSIQLKNKELWKIEKYALEQPYSTTFTIDSIKQNSLYVKYEYWNKENSKLIQNQSVEFKIDKLNKSLGIKNKSDLQ